MKLFIYQIIFRVVLSLAWLTGFFLPKLRETFRDRREWNLDHIRARWEHLRREFPRDTPVFWFHAASVGEFEQIRPVMEAWREGAGAGGIYVFSYFSPSVRERARACATADFVFPLPFDLQSRQRELVNNLRPALLVFTKYDVWPALVGEIRRLKENREIDQSSSLPLLALVCGTFGDSSSRFGPGMGRLLADALQKFDYLSFVSFSEEEKLNRLAGWDPPPGLLTDHAGDSRWDRVLRISQAAERDAVGWFSPRDAGRSGGPPPFFLVAGNTYPVSEQCFLEFFTESEASRRPGFHLILVPHETDPRRVEQIRALIERRGLTDVSEIIESASRLDPDRKIHIVARQGVLMQLYSLANLIFVGGSLRGKVHSIPEAAVFHSPVITGPHIGNSPEALALVKKGGLARARSTEDLKARLTRLLDSPEERLELQTRLKEFMATQLGATGRIHDALAGIYQRVSPAPDRFTTDPK